MKFQDKFTIALVAFIVIMTALVAMDSCYHRTRPYPSDPTSARK